MTFINVCRVVKKLLLLFFLVVHKLFEAMFTETFAVRAFVVMLLYDFAVTPVGHRM